MADGSISVGFFVTQPQDFWSLKSGDGAVAGDFEQSLTADLLIDGFALACGSLVVPEQGGPDYLARVVEEDGPVHLTREAERHCRSLRRPRKASAQQPSFGPAPGRGLGGACHAARRRPTSPPRSKRPGRAREARAG